MTTHTDESDELNIPAVLREVRLQLAAARREAEERVRWLAQREAEIAITIGGKNEAERKALLTMAVAMDVGADNLRTALREAQERVTLLEVEEQYLRDLRRAREWAIRERHGVTWED